MKVKSLQLIQNLVIEERTRKYIRQGTAGILLGVLFMYSILSSITLYGNITRAGEQNQAPEANRTAVFGELFPAAPIDIFRKRAAAVKNMTDILCLPEDRICGVPYDSISEGAGSKADKSNGRSEVETLLPADVSGAEWSEEVAPPVSTTLTYSGTLRKDYCVGSSVDLSGLTFTWRNGKEETKISVSECEITGLDTQTAGEKVMTAAYEGCKVDIPYGVVNYCAVIHGNGGTVQQERVSLWDYRLDGICVQTPRRLGKEFDGWYRDQQCTVPFTGAMQGEVSLHLYAGWKEFGKFVCDDTGKITSYSGTGADLTDFTLRLPGHADCTGIGKDAFTVLNSEAFEAFIPSNITYIEPGAFDELMNMIYIHVDPANPNYCSVNGIVYTKDKSQRVIFPQGRKDWPE